MAECERLRNILFLFLLGHSPEYLLQETYANNYSAGRIHPAWTDIHAASVIWVRCIPCVHRSTPTDSSAKSCPNHRIFDPAPRLDRTIGMSESLVSQGSLMASSAVSTASPGDIIPRRQIL